MNYQIKRGSTLIAVVRPNSGSLEEVVNGQHVAKISFTLPGYMDFYIGDTIEVNGYTMIADAAATWEKVAQRQFNYSMTFVHESYQLLDVNFLGLDEENELTQGEFYLMADAETVIDLIIANLNRDYSGWTKGVIEETETVNHTFNNDNCRGALTRLAETYKTEFWFSGKTINFSKKGENSGLSFRYGKGNGLKSLTRNVLDKKIITRLYIKGSDRNLPADYTGKFLRLPGGGFTIQETEKVNRYGIIEGWEVFPDIFPKRVGTVTSVTNAFTFTDVGLDFDINNQLIPGVSAKVIFQTGQLAGWEFEIAAGGYNHTTKTITILKNQDEKAIEVPSETGLKAAIGDKYILVDIIMPQTYIEAAENELEVAALAVYDQISDEAVNYDAVTDRIYLRQNEIQISLGDYVNIAEVNPPIDKNIRVIGKTTNLLDLYDVKLTLSDTVAVANVVRERIAAQAIQRAIDVNRLNDINRTRQNRKTQAEMQNMIFNPDTGKFLNNKLDVDWLTAQLITVGSKAGDFRLFTTFVPNFEGNANKIGWTAGQLAHNQLTTYQNGIWNFTAGDVSGLDPAKAYYIYCNCPFGDDTGTISISDEVKSVDVTPNQYTFTIGILSSVIDGFRTVTNTYGSTMINGGQIQTGMIKNQSGQNVLDVDNRTFYGSFKFSNGDDVQTVTNQIKDDLIDVQEEANEALQEAYNATATAEAVEEKTDFLTTTIDGNVVATGTMLVGDAAGNNNAGISGVVEAVPGESVRFWAGSTFANRDTAPFRVQQDGKVFMTNAVISSSNTGRRLQISSLDNNITMYDYLGEPVISIDELAIIGWLPAPWPDTGVRPVFGPGIFIGKITDNYTSISTMRFETTGMLIARSGSFTDEIKASNIELEAVSASGSLPNVGTVLVTGDSNLYTYPSHGQIQVIKNITTSGITLSAAESPGRNILIGSAVVSSITVNPADVLIFQYYQPNNQWVLISTNNLNQNGSVTFAKRVDFNDVVYFNRIGGAFGNCDVRMIDLPETTSGTYYSLRVHSTTGRIYRGA